MRRYALNSSIMAAAGLLLAACSDDPGQSASLKAPAIQPAQLQQSAEQEPFNLHLLHLANDSHIQALASINALQDSVNALLLNNTDANLQQARTAWREAYSAFLRSRIYSYLPITEPLEWQRQQLGYRDLMMQIDSWPVEGGYLDYLPGYPHTGIVNDLAMPLNREELLRQHRFTDAGSASVGFHVIEFLLWGDDGQRPASDFNPASSGDNDDPGQKHPERRREYLQLTTTLLQEQVNRLQMRWDSNTGYYAKLLRDSLPGAALSAAMIAVERWSVEQLKHQQNEDLRSPFSETSEIDQQTQIRVLKQWLLGAEADPGALPQLLTDNESLLQQWQSLLNSDQQPTAAGSDSEDAADMLPTQSAIDSTGSDENNFDEELKQLQSLLHQTAQTLHIELP